MGLIELSPESLALLAEPAPAVLTTHRRDGAAATSPVWFRFHDGQVEVVLAAGDVKVRHLERDPRCVLVVFEARPPFRGVRISGTATLGVDAGSAARLAIASRFLGGDAGREFVELRGGEGLVLRVDDASVQEWDLTPILPPSTTA